MRRAKHYNKGMGDAGRDIVVENWHACRAALMLDDLSMELRDEMSLKRRRECLLQYIEGYKAGVEKMVKRINKDFADMVKTFDQDEKDRVEGNE
jgi:hypothetical protein